MIDQLVVFPFLLAFVISCAVTSIVIRVYSALGWVDKSTKKDHPKNIHNSPVPRGGGVGIYMAIMLTTMIMVPFDTHMAAIMVGATILLVLGVLDDLYNISPYVRLLFGTLAAGVVVAAGIRIDFVSSPLGGVVDLSVLASWIPGFLAVVWIVWTMNFVNMGAKGLDGQLPGVVVVASIVVGVLSFRFVNDVTAWPSTIVTFSLAGAYLGLLVFNIYPQRIMPGWGGGALAGYFLAVLAIISGAKIATVLIVLGIPLMDVLYAVLRRLVAGKSPVWGDNQHLHHLLLKLGISKRTVAGIYWILTAILGFVALQLDAKTKLYAIVMLAVLVGGVMLWINLLLSQKRSE